MRLTSTIFLKLTERFRFLRTIQIVDVMFETSSKADVNDWYDGLEISWVIVNC